MKIHSRTELARLWIAGLFHTIESPEDWIVRLAYAWLFVYYVAFFRAEGFMQGVIFGMNILWLGMVLDLWYERAKKWVRAHEYKLLRLIVRDEDESIKKAFYLTVPPDFPKDWEVLCRMFKGML